jgi:hypothetical protein
MKADSGVVIGHIPRNQDLSTVRIMAWRCSNSRKCGMALCKGLWPVELIAPTIEKRTVDIKRYQVGSFTRVSAGAVVGIPAAGATVMHHADSLFEFGTHCGLPPVAAIAIVHEA